MRSEDIFMQKTRILLLTLAFFGLCAPEAEATWWIDGGELHISAHMENSCQDCHEDISAQNFHPNPADVDKGLRDFFSEDKCLACHGEVMDSLNEGVHGNEKIRDSEEFAYCIGCHRPHSQPRLGENRMGEFDPSRPKYEQCGACHEERSALPTLSTEDEGCMACHGRVDPGSPEGKEQIERFCFHCHGLAGNKAQKLTGELVSLIDINAYRSVPHAHLPCTECHPSSAEFNHSVQTLGDCRRCHLPHDEKVAGDAHSGVSCGACHLGGIEPVRDPESKLVRWHKDDKTGAPLRIHEMVRESDHSFCNRCHFKGNRVGAVAMLLPAKSIMCMPCHAATFSVGDTTTSISLVVFLAGMVMVNSYWLSGSVAGRSDASPVGKLFYLLWNVVRAIFSPRIFLIIKAMILDVLLQRRLYRQSGPRWFIHSLIFLPFVFRFSWGMVSLVISLWKPEWALAWHMLDKNHPATAFLFDLTGIMAILGVGLAFLRGQLRHRYQPSGLPRQDRVALGLIGGIVVVGFLLEGLRIAMTGWPEGAGFAVVGYAISLLFGESPLWTGVFGYLWYIHAVLTGAFVVYLPFSRLLHIIMAPVVLAMNAVTEDEHRRLKGELWTRK